MFESCDSNWADAICYLENFEINVINKHKIIDYFKTISNLYMIR